MAEGLPLRILSDEGVLLGRTFRRSCWSGAELEIRAGG